MPPPDNDYQQLLQTLLPPGPAWEGEHPLLEGLAPSLAQVHQRADRLMTELHPAQATELIDRYEKLCGLPDKCLDTHPQTREERQEVLNAKINTVGGINAVFFQHQLTLLGYPEARIDTFQHEERAPEKEWGEKWRYYWRIHLPTQEKIRWQTCLSACHEPLRHWGNPVVECVIERLCPSHTKVLFAYHHHELHWQTCLSASNTPICHWGDPLTGERHASH